MHVGCDNRRQTGKNAPTGYDGTGTAMSVVSLEAFGYMLSEREREGGRERESEREREREGRERERERE